MNNGVFFPKNRCRLSIGDVLRQALCPFLLSACLKIFYPNKKHGSCHNKVYEPILFLDYQKRHMNQVLHNGKTPNPVEVILTSQSFICRFKEAFNLYKGHKHCQRSRNRTKDCRQNWQLLIKVAATKNKRTRRSGVKTRHQAAQEALLLSLMKAKDMGYQRLYVISNDKYLVQICNYVKKARLGGWTEPFFQTLAICINRD